MGQYLGQTERSIHALCMTVPPYLTQEAGHALLMQVRSHRHIGVL